uniref:Craniofacial development protein 1 n=1 Tax=Timema genevievae TaxID=629358 RepID=A0A7R9K4E1_TIMGE|nr:unnamed protein product [Timema genevievae]
MGLSGSVTSTAYLETLQGVVLTELKNIPALVAACSKNTVMNFDKEVPKLASDSDDSDEDYVPAGAESNPPSEDDSDGPEEVESGSEGEGASSKRRRRGNKPSISRKRQCKQATPEELNGDDEDEETEVKKLTEEEEKQKVDALWKDFMKDTGPAAKSAPSRSRPSAPPEDISKNKVKITKVFEFAGEEVRCLTAALYIVFLLSDVSLLLSVL